MPFPLIISFKQIHQKPITLTDVLLKGSQMLYVGDDEIISQTFHVNPEDRSVFQKIKDIRLDVLKFLVGEAGLEPARPQ